MIEALEKIGDYFGTIGIASVACWLAAGLLMLLYVAGLRRSLVAWPALAAAVAGLVLGNINSNNISDIKIDQSADLQAARERAEKEKQEEESAGTEEDPGAEDDVGTNEEEGSDEPAPDTDVPEEEEAAPPREHAYRQGGKVARTAGKEADEKFDLGAGMQDQPLIANVRMMKDYEVAHANRLDRVNLFFVRLTFALAVLAVTVDYLRRFNLTFGALFPLPLGGPTIDAFFPKTHMVCVGRRRKGAWKRFLKRVVRKGETFIYLGDDDPHRARRLGRLPLLPKSVWPLDKITRSDGDREFDDETLFESAWFGRGCFVIVDDGPRASDLLTGLADFLQLRHATRASARHTVNVIWNLPALPPENTLARLAALCPETNFKLLMSTNQKLTETQKKCFDEFV